ncbi:MAG: NmrA family transcriptional regulator [Proteobacteria bacterium]|jgi:uncharacterized protein YbjT (DUF2867 family)|nr:NmrA family transcriptional regulator [Pseudomonadota bacterium]MDA1300860.1 NmrA family transcriptional regulator [Pseudomonadota bacterium]
MIDSPILIVGSQGKTGARVARRLRTAGVPVRGVSRSTHIVFDWDDPGTWSTALKNVRAAYVTYHPDLSILKAESDIRSFASLARAAGVDHIVLLSGRGEEGAKRAEAALRSSGLAWNVVRASWFAQNFSENFMLDGILAGELVLPECTAKEPFIDADDIADVAVAALLEPGLRNRAFDVTGPRLMTFAQCLAEISEAVGHEISLTEVPLDEYLAELSRQGIPKAFRLLLAELFGQLFDGRNAHVTDGVRQALGRPATDFSDYARETAATGVWEGLAPGRVA